MELAVIKPPNPSKEQAFRLIRTEMFVPVPVIAVALGVSRNLAYEGVKDGSIPSVRIASKIRVPTAPYREKLVKPADSTPAEAA